MSVTFPLVVPFTTTEAPITGPNESSTTHTTFPFCWDRLTDGLSGVISAKALSGTAKVPASSIRLTNLVFFNIEYIFKRNNTYHENGLHLLSVFIRSCSLDFAYFYSVFLCFCNLVLSELWFLIISYPGQRYEIFISLYVFLLKKFIRHSFLTIQTYRRSTSIRQYQTFEPF